MGDEDAARAAHFSSGESRVTVVYRVN